MGNYLILWALNKKIKAGFAFQNFRYEAFVIQISKNRLRPMISKLLYGPIPCNSTSLDNKYANILKYTDFYLLLRIDTNTNKILSLASFSRKRPNHLIAQ